MKRLKRTALLASAVILMLVVVCGVYISDYYRTDEAAISVLDSEMVHQSEDKITFLPENPSKAVAVMRILDVMVPRKGMGYPQFHRKNSFRKRYGY